MRIESSLLISSRLRRLVFRLLCLATVWTFTAGATSCSTDGSAGPTFVTDLTLKTAGGAVSEEFAPGEPVTLEITVRNRARREVVVQFPSGYQFDFVVVDRGTDRIRWKWSRHVVFIQASTEIVFAPDETRTFAIEWSQVDDDGRPVGPGNYEARGVLTFAEFATDPLFPHQQGSPLRPLTIR